MDIDDTRTKLKRIIIVIVGIACLAFIYMIVNNNRSETKQNSAIEMDQDSGSSMMSFLKTTHDFGEINEADGIVSYQFEFTNNGNSPLIIQEVKASCGCTTPEWTREPIIPGEKGIITAAYNPEKRPGTFNKSLTIASTANSQKVRLYIRGSVIPIPRAADEEYPVAIGAMRVKLRTVSFETISTEKPVNQSFNVYNDTDEALTFSRKYKAPDHIKLDFSPQSLPPKTVGTVQVTYDPRGLKSLGIRTDFIEFKTDEWSNSVKKIRILASLEEYFPPMTSEELALTPRLIIEKPEHDFGEIAQGRSVTNKFVISNTGKTDLNIRQTKASCGCTASKPEKSTLKPGESSTIKVTFDSEGRSGEQSKTIFVFSNDPVNPTQKMVINCIVVVAGDS
jgi:hypothetical protein